MPKDKSLWSVHDVVVNYVRRYSKLELGQKMEEFSSKIESLLSSLILLRQFILWLGSFWLVVN